MAAAVVVPYDEKWPRLFEVERARLKAVLAPWLEQDLQHIGSTSVPGLAAKPIIDMIAGVRDLTEAQAAFEPLQALGYRYRPHRPEAHLFTRPGYGVHLTEPGSDIWRERLAFRDALRASDELAAEYAEWKLRHASGGPQDTPYTAGKRPFVARVLAQAGLELKEDRERLAEEVLVARPVAASGRAPS